jgi:uncharacterized phage protein (TIGR02218 family)
VKTLPAGLQTHLDSGATTLCWVWVVTTADYYTFAFTDHDHDVAFGSVTAEAATALTGSEVRQSLGLSVDDADAAGALSSEHLNEADLAAGKFDNAWVEIWRVNWADTSQRVLMMSGSIGEVRRGDNAFTAELRSLAHYLNQQRGRTYQYACDAALGDGRCGADIYNATFTGAGVVTAAPTSYRIEASGLGAYASGWFNGGLITWTSGANAGRSMEIKGHWIASGIVMLEFWRSMADAIAVGDTFSVVAGCDKTFSTCKAKFSNSVNFRGFPYIPGSTYMLDVAKDGEYSLVAGRSMFNG